VSPSPLLQEHTATQTNIIGGFQRRQIHDLSLDAVKDINHNGPNNIICFLLAIGKRPFVPIAFILYSTCAPLSILFVNLLA
jgi:hypothetical protein